MKKFMVQYSHPKKDIAISDWFEDSFLIEAYSLFEARSKARIKIARSLQVFLILDIYAH